MSIVGDIVGGLTGGAAAATPTGAISAVSSTVETIVKRIWQDPTERDKALIELRRLEETGELQRITLDNGLLQGQIDVNKIDAASGSNYRGGWRPAIGWTCAIALFCYFIPRCLASVGLWVIACMHGGAEGAFALVPFPELGIGDLLSLTGTMLGTAWMRSNEKKAGVA